MTDPQEQVAAPSVDLPRHHQRLFDAGVILWEIT